jgi:acyl carrier protein
VPIGHPIANTDVWVLDPELNPVSSGETGEIYIGGVGVARGYLNRPELTAERFLVPPWAHDRSARLYRTGDLARWRAEGALEYLGRTDDQVKLSGYRVEPAEVATALREHLAVRDTVVIPEQEPHSHKRLVAYVVPRWRPAPDPRELREFLQGKLPQFMMPADFVILEAIPLTANGKIDRDALPRPERSAVAPSPVAAGGRLEEIIAGVWRQVLRRDVVAVQDNFFDLGGDSLQLISVHSSLQNLVGQKFSVTDLFEFPTIAALAGRLGLSGSAAASGNDAHERARRQREVLARRSQSPRTA